MPLQISGQFLKSGAQGPIIPQDQQGSVVVSELNARYYVNVYQGNVFNAATQATGAFTAASGTATGFILSNPAGSGKNLVLLEILFSVTVPLVAASIVSLYANLNPIAAATTHTTPLTINNALLGGGQASVAKADSSATLPAVPVVVRTITSGGAGAPTITTLAPYIKDEVAGAVVIAPGCAVSIQGTTAVAGGAASVTWAELPI